MIALEEDNEMLLREDVASELQWDLTTIFSSDEMWLKEFKEVEELSYQNNTYKEIVIENATICGSLI